MVVVVVVVVVTVVAVVRRHKRPSALWASGTHERGQLGKKKRKKNKKKKRRNRPNDRSTRPFALEATLDTPIGSSAIPVRVNDDGTHSARFYWSSPSSPSTTPPPPPPLLLLPSFMGRNPFPPLASSTRAYWARFFGFKTKNLISI